MSTVTGQKIRSRAWEVVLALFVLLLLIATGLIIHNKANTEQQFSGSTVAGEVVLVNQQSICIKPENTVQICGFLVVQPGVPAPVFNDMVTAEVREIPARDQVTGQVVKMETYIFFTSPSGFD